MKISTQESVRLTRGRDISLMLDAEGNFSLDTAYGEAANDGQWRVAV